MIGIAATVCATFTSVEVATTVVAPTVAPVAEVPAVICADRRAISSALTGAPASAVGADHCCWPSMTNRAAVPAGIGNGSCAGIGAGVICCANLLSLAAIGGDRDVTSVPPCWINPAPVAAGYGQGW